MTIKKLLEHLDGAGLSITDWEEMKPYLAQLGVNLTTELNEVQWTDTEFVPGQTAEERALFILTDASIDAHLFHTGGGIWVTEACSTTIPGRSVWVSDYEGRDGGRFLVGAYPEPGGQDWIDHLSGPCTAEGLPDRVRRALTAPAEE